MPQPPNSRAPKIDLVAYTRTRRLLSGILVFASRAAILGILAMFLYSNDPPTNALRLLRLFSCFAVLPALAALLIRRLDRATVTVSDDALVVEQLHQRVEIPTKNIAAVNPWLIPLPSPGMALTLRSGRRFDLQFALPDPSCLVEALANAGGCGHLNEATKHPAILYAQSKDQGRRKHRFAFLLRFPVFALVPTLPLFRLHQYIAYGGTFGEYYQYGAAAYLTGFAIHWSSLTIYLVLYAALLRVPVEAIAMGAAIWTPQYAVAVRRAVDGIETLSYYGGVPLVLILRFYPW